MQYFPGRVLLDREFRLPMKLVALVPAATSIEPECEAALSKLRARDVAVRVFRGASAIDQVRSMMASDAIRDGFEKLLWVDSDIAFEPDDVDRLLADDEPFICGVYPKKGNRSLTCHTLPGTKELTFGEDGEVIEILYAAGGFTLVDASVYAAVREKLALPTCNAQFGAPFVPYYQPMVKDTPDGPWYLAEDFAFSDRARQAGFAVHADTRIRLKHIGRYAYQWEDAGKGLERHSRFRLVIRT